MTPDKKMVEFKPHDLDHRSFFRWLWASAQHRRTGDQLGGLPKVEKRGVAKPGGNLLIRLVNEIRLTSWYGKYPITYRVSYIFIMPTWLIQLVH